jgi:hypothetical protein
MSELLKEFLNSQTELGLNTYYWSRKPGNFMDFKTGSAVSYCSFSGTIQEWYSTLVETIRLVAYLKDEKTLNIRVNPRVAVILEACSSFMPFLENLKCPECHNCKPIGKLKEITVWVYNDYPDSVQLFNYDNNKCLAAINVLDMVVI